MPSRPARLVLASLALLFAPALLLAQDSGVVARVGSEPITTTELEEAWHRNDAAARIRMLQQLYDTRRRALDIVIGERLIAREASARAITRDALLAAELPSRTLPVTDGEIDLIYERNKDRFGGRSAEEMRPEIRVMMEEQRPLQALHAYMNELRLAADDVVVLLDPPRQDVETSADDAVRGPADAPIQIVEFSDFDCPYCQRATDTMAKLLERYSDQIRFVYKDYPLPSHPNAFKAAEAGKCANAQGKFWPLHDKMFASQGSLDVASLKTYASELGLDATAFASCLDSGRYTQRVQQDLDTGVRHGVSSTPTVFINGRLVTGAVPYDVFDGIIREELAARGEGPASHRDR